MKLEGKVAIVTGGGRGLGRCIALAYAREGASLVLAARTAAEIREVAREVRALGRKAVAIVADVSREKAVASLVERALRHFGRIDILVNNAGIGLIKPVKDISLEEWNRVIGVNLTGAFLCAREVWPVMTRQGSGVIINVSSGLGRRGRGTFGVYATSKGGLEILTQVLADEGAPHNIRVNALSPGGSSVTRLGLEAGLPRATMLRPEVIRAAAVWLASEESSGVRGQSFDAAEWNAAHGLGSRESWLSGKGG